MNYFDGVHTIADGKARYRELSKRYHPNGQTGNRQKWEAVHTQWQAVEPLLRLIDSIPKANGDNGRGGLESVLSGVMQNIPPRVWDRGIDAVMDWVRKKTVQQTEPDYTTGDWG